MSTRLPSQDAQAWSWFSQGSWAILDQGLFAGTNFLSNILLARWLEPSAYGVFAVAYSAFICLATLHTALLTEPMLIFGAGKYAHVVPRYLRLLLYGHWSVAGAMALLVSLAALVCWWCAASELAAVLAAVAFALPCILLQWLVRRAFYVRAQPYWSAGGGLLYLGLMLLGMQMTVWCQALTPASALAIMGAASLVVGLTLAACLLRPSDTATPALTFADVMTAHWQYGKWASATTAATWVAREVSYPLLPLWVGLEGSAAMRVLMNLVMPILHANAALAIMLIPRCMAVWKHAGTAGLRRCLRQAWLVLGLGAALYWVGLLVGRRPMLQWLYAGRYDAYADLLLLLGALPLGEAALTIVGLELRLRERPELVCWGHGLALAFTLTAGLWLLAQYGVVGAVLGRLLATLVTTGALLWLRRASVSTSHRVRPVSALDGTIA